MPVFWLCHILSLLSYKTKKTLARPTYMFWLLTKIVSIATWSNKYLKMGHFIQTNYLFHSPDWFTRDHTLPHTHSPSELFKLSFIWLVLGKCKVARVLIGPLTLLMRLHHSLLVLQPSETCLLRSSIMCQPSPDALLIYVCFQWKPYISLCANSLTQ